MKRISIILMTALAGAVATPADDSKAENAPRLAGVEQARTLTRDELKVALSVKDLLGVELVDRQGANLGRVVDFTLKDGKFDSTIVSTSGTLGINEVLVAIPFQSIEQKPGTQNLILNVTKADFDAFVASSRPPKRSNTPARQVGSPATGKRTAAARELDITKIRAAIDSDPGISTKARAVEIQKQDGRLVVSGTVDNSRERERILEIVRRNSEGEVVDELRVN